MIKLRLHSGPAPPIHSINASPLMILFFYDDLDDVKAGRLYLPQQFGIALSSFMIISLVPDQPRRRKSACTVIFSAMVTTHLCRVRRPCADNGPCPSGSVVKAGRRRAKRQYYQRQGFPVQ
jgi:hypothetical protein